MRAPRWLPWLALLAGCPGGGDVPERTVAEGVSDARLEAPPPMSPGTQAALGPFRFEAHLDRRSDGGPRFPSVQQDMALDWGGADTSQLVITRDLTLALQEIRLPDRMLRRMSEGAPFLTFDRPPGDTIVLQRPLDLWAEAIGPLADRVGWERLDDVVHEGREARRYRLRPAPPPASERDPSRTFEELAAAQPVTLRRADGLAVVDLLTGNRLLAEVDLGFTSRGGEPGREVSVRYTERRTLLPGPPTIEVPEDARILDRTGDARRKARNAVPAPPPRRDGRDRR